MKEINSGYTDKELTEIIEIVERFKIKNFWRLSCLIRGRRVANRNPKSKVRNFSTMTGCFPLSTDKWVYLVYAYPLSVVHRFFDGLTKWASEKYCRKIVLPRNWRAA